MLFKDLTNSQLNLLRARIILDTNLPVRMYKNPFGVSEEICKDFFEGYLEYLLMLADEVSGCTKLNRYSVAEAQDNYSTLVEYRKIYEQRQLDNARGIKRYTA